MGVASQETRQKGSVMAEIISLTGLNKADVLAALYNASRPQMMGFMQYEAKPMTRAEAEQILKKATCFDYLNGRVMKVDISSDELDPWLYDRDNGQGAAQMAIEALARSGETNPVDIQVAHQVNTMEAAEKVEDHLGHLGLKDVASPLHKKVQEARKKIRG